MCYNGTFRFKKLDDSFWNGETFRFADYIWESWKYLTQVWLSLRLIVLYTDR